MRVLIIEDEPLATNKLESLLKNIDPLIEIVGKLESVKESIDWLKTQSAPDLAFVDVQLTDSTSFDIFKSIEVNFPVIFTTAYDDYILDSFEYNTLDYLLKPIQEERLRKAVEKMKRMESHFVNSKLNELLHTKGDKATKKRFLVKKGIDYQSVYTKDIAYFFTEHKVVFLKDKKRNLFIIDRTLTDLEGELDKRYFFRANRKYIINIDALDKFKSDNGKILLTLSPAPQEEVVVSKENAPNFRNWVDA